MRKVKGHMIRMNGTTLNLITGLRKWRVVKPTTVHRLYVLLKNRFPIQTKTKNKKSPRSLVGLLKKSRRTVPSGSVTEGSTEEDGPRRLSKGLHPIF